MQVVLFSVAFVLAAFCAGVMGFAIQRGSTCTVAAVDEVVAQRSPGRLLSLLEIDKDSFDALAAARREATDRVVKQFTNLLITQDEARAELMYGPVGDVPAGAGSVFYGPANLVPQGETEQR